MAHKAIDEIGEEIFHSLCPGIRYYMEGDKEAYHYAAKAALKAMKNLIAKIPDGNKEDNDRLNAFIDKVLDEKRND